jgi:hypothetical protein
MHGRVYQRRDGGWEVRWQVHRNYPTEEEARAAAAGPPPEAKPRRSRSKPKTTPKPRPLISDEIIRFAVRANECGASWNLIARALTDFGIPTPTGKPSWRGATLQNAARRWRDRRDAADERARKAEWRIEESVK